MTRRLVSHYHAVFNKIQEMIQNFSPSQAIADWEKAPRNAFILDLGLFTDASHGNFINIIIADKK